MRTLVTGANGGLGAAIVDYLREQNIEVLPVTRSAPGTLHADLASVEDCERLAGEAGEIDAVIHTVGGFASGSSTESLRAMFEINVVTAVNVFNAFLPAMKTRGRGALLAIGSRAGVEPSPGIAAYAASKSALVHYVRSLDAELRMSGVRVNVVLPATIDTPANRAAMPNADRAGWVSPLSIAKVVSWLVSSDAADVGGAAVPVYGKA